jgi:hypothetical protein
MVARATPVTQASAGEPTPPRPRREVGKALCQAGQVGDRTISPLPLGGKITVESLIVASQALIVGFQGVDVCA